MSQIVMSSWGLITSEPIAFASMVRCLKTKDHDHTFEELEPSSGSKSQLELRYIVAS